MRNLKRVLSLTLATAMLFGMMVMGAAAADKTAADLTDSDKITNKEAVTLLVDLGIVEGKSDGTFSPAETVNRATMAKLITMMMLGDVDQSSFKGTNTDLTDITGHWAEGYIKYCYANKIISGDGAGHFLPDQPVDAVSAAKMLLVAVGYDSADRGYTGGSWSINVMRDAQSATEWVGPAAGVTRALTKGLNIKSTDPLSRDNAAQMIFNTLFVTNKKPVFGWDMGKQFISSYSDQPSLAATTYNGLVRVVGVLDSVNVTAKSAVIGGSTVKINAETGNIGSTVVYYKVGSPAKVLSTAAVPTTAEVLATSTNGTAFTDLLTRGETGYLGLTLDENVSIYVNGAKAITDTLVQVPGTPSPITVSVANNGIYVTSNDTDYAALLVVGEAKDATGDIIDFLDADSNGKVDTIKITEYTLSVITKTTAAKADGTEATISLKGVSGTIDQSLVVGDFAALAKDDVVLYAKIGDMFYVSEPETFEGSVSRYNSTVGTVVIGGTTYSVAGTPNVSGMTTANAYNFGSVDAVFYKDNNGYIVAFDGISTVTKHAVVDAIAYVGGTGANPNGYFEAKLIFNDGTVETVKVNKIAGNTLLATNGAADNVSGVYDINTFTNTKISVTADDNASAFANAVYTDKVDSKDNYDLTRVDTAHTGVKVEKGNANVAGQATANNDTVYVYKTTAVGKADVITVYTGYKNAPTTSTSVNVSVATKGGYATFVFVTDTAINVGDSTTDVIVFLATEGVENNGDGTQTFLYKASVNGEVDTYKATSDQTTETNYALNIPLDVTIDSDGNISGTGAGGAFVAATGYITGNATANASNGTLKTNATIAAATPLPSISNAAFSFDGSETVYFVGGKDVVEGSASDILAGMFFYVKTVDTTTVAGRIAMKTVYVRTPDDATPSATPATLAATSSDMSLTIGQGDLLAANPAVSDGATGDKLTVTAATVLNGYVTVTISGTGTTVTASGYNGAVAAADYVLAAGDVGSSLTITVTSSQAGKGIVTNVYSVAVSA